MADSERFAELTDPFRRELLAHCYRILGSVDDAEDLVQETYLRAWRSFDGFEGRSSLRVWLYKIATRACLTDLERRARRPLPSGIGTPSAPDTAVTGADLPWLQPLPDRLIAEPGAGPEALVTARGSVRLAFVAALQHLPARQRAVLILRDVLGWRAAEVADVLDTSATAVNSALLRARVRIGEVGIREDDTREPSEPQRRATLERYVEAFETQDTNALLRLLRHDVELEMPPVLEWFAGRADVLAFLLRGPLSGRYTWRMLPVSVNGQPATASYTRAVDDSGGVLRAHGVQVLGVTPGGISRITSFHDPRWVVRLGLPETLSGGSDPLAVTACHGGAV
ncbi:sigma-70 family RNA polymerase sigma factor [Yinghuangia seranimata]|uniref:sigma-70 family RNA polymerase sigma factor n=1 Tax=Yinghuangia seranimata TaxID=408067 RepID=UPI00248C7BD9|nr:sigma-70 family RNA polymerase sigma factor [Yinghuangia seranimata]MDI2130756.1 sigma-70 family RNA polymerase sigma factor [Yinghuangia seranimata]